MLEAELKRLFDVLKVRHKNKNLLRITIHHDLSGNVSTGLYDNRPTGLYDNRLEEFENVADFAAVLTDPQWALKRRLEEIETQVARLRTEIAEINRELGNDDDDIPF